MKELIVFDLDGTLAESKTELDSEMSNLLSRLLEKRKVAIISGGSYSQYQKQFLKSLDCPENLLKNLYLFPTCSTSFYLYKDNNWEKIYSKSLQSHQKQKIKNAFQKMFQEYGFVTTLPFNEIVEDRSSQITFSALGQNAPYEKKKGWDTKHEKRKEMKKILEKHIPEFDVKIGGSTSLDITEKGIDKAYGIEQIEKHLSIPKNRMLFIGDALFEGGNDYPVKRTGVECLQVSGPEETKKIISSLISET